jgi:CRP-like cAMP-binding protein
MALGLEVPRLYVLSQELFDRRRGMNVAEAEFPAYYNFFILKRRIRLLVDDAAAEGRIRAVFQESLFGPQTPPPEEEFAQGYAAERRPDFRRESDHFRRDSGGNRIEVDRLVEFLRWDEASRVRLDERVEIVRLEDGSFEVHDGDAVVARAGARVELPDRGPPRTAPRQPFEPPAFGVTVLGASHGFDPAGKTTGFIVWIGHRGLLVDPPVDAGEQLREQGVPPKLIDGVILTHCHADHDSGTFQKILEEGRITLFATPTILGSFLRKYSSLSGIGEELLRRTFVWCPIKIGTPIRVNGAEIWFFYTLHSIPTTGFEIFYGGKSLAFSADSLYDPERIQKLAADGVIHRERAEALVAFPWHHTVVLHEAGVPPLHTPTSVLANLPDSVKERLYLVHIAEKDVPSGKGLKAAQVGLDHTIDIEVQPPPFAEAIHLLDVFCSVDLFRDFPLSRAQEILHHARSVSYPKGTRIIERGSKGDNFYIIVSGTVSVVPDGRALKSYHAGDYFGETALLLDQPRNADVVARTDVDLVEIDRYGFLYLLRGTDIPRRLERLARMRAEHSWELFEKNSVLRTLTSAQKTQLQSYLESRPIKEREILWRAGDSAQEAFLIDDGAVSLEAGGVSLEPFRCGAFLGEFDALRLELPLGSTARVAHPGRVFRIGGDDLGRWFQDNPGILLSFLGTRFVE